MEDYGHLTRAELESLIRELKAERTSAAHSADEKPQDFPVFGEWHRREFDRSPWAMRIIEHATFRFLAVNDAAVKLYGYSREEFLRMTPRQTRHPEELNDFHATLEEPTGLFRHRGPRRHVKKNGEIIVVEVVAQDILFDGVKARWAMYIDVTERDRVLGLLRQNQEEFRTLAEHSPDIVSRLDRQFRHLYVSPAVTTATGLPPEAFVGKTVSQVGMPADLVARWEAQLAELFATAREQRLESVFEGPSGLRYYESRIVPELAADGSVETAVVITRDFTERKRVEELLWRREQEFESLAENLPDLVARYDRNHRFLYVNSAIERILGFARDKAMGMTQREVGLPEELAALYDESLAGVFASGRSHKVEFRLELPGGERFFEAYHVPEGGMRHNVETVLCVARDITERKHAEMAMQRSAELTRLLESLARAANEAVTPEAAMAACLGLICGHGGWAIGRVALYGEDGKRGMSARSIWHAPDGDDFNEFIRMSEGHVPNSHGVLISRVLQEQAAVWIEDMEQVPNHGRRKAAVEHGLRSAFAFPIILRGEVVAIIEMFSREARSQDPLTMGAAQSLASQLARLVEREWAHQANARMAAIVESSRDAILSRTLDGTIVTWNPGAERLLGYTAAEIVGRNMRVIRPPEFDDLAQRRQAILLQGLPVPAHETTRIAKDGRRIHVSTSPAAIRDSNGKICGISAIIRDISELKSAEQELRQAQQKLQVAVRGGAVGLWDWDVGSGAVYFSPEWKQQLGYADHELPNLLAEWNGRVHPEDDERIRSTIKSFLAQPWPDYRAEYRLRHKDGSYRWILSRAAAQLGESGNVEHMFGCHVDITEQKKAEVERLADVVGQRDALVREVHHRIKNSLQGIIGLLRQKVRKYPAMMYGMEEAIAQLQSVAVVYGIQGMRPDGTLSLAEMMEAICYSAGSLIGGRVDVRLNRESPRPACIAGSEAVSVAVALNELVFNALKHQRSEAGKKRAQIVLHETEESAEIRISNRGSLPKDFDFARGQAVGDGLGLVRTLLTSPGGSITFNAGRNEVEVILTLGPPLLAGRMQTSVRRIGDVVAKQERGPAPHTGGRRRPVGAGGAG